MKTCNEPKCTEVAICKYKAPTGLLYVCDAHLDTVRARYAPAPPVLAQLTYQETVS